MSNRRVRRDVERGRWLFFDAPINLYCTLVELPPLPVVPLNVRDRSDPELQPHLRGLCGWILANEGGGPPTPAQAHAAEHTWRVQNQISFAGNQENDAVISDVAARTNALVFLADSTLRDPAGHVVVGRQRRSTGDVPYPELGRARQARSRSQVAAWGFETPEHLPPSPCEVEVVLRPAREIQARAQALAMVALRAESVRDGEPIDPSRLRGDFPDATPTAEEIAFLEASHVDPHIVARFGWRFESLLALQWAAGLVAELPFPSEPCDAAAVIGRVLEPHCDAPSLRSITDILDVLDVHYRLDWWATDRVMRGQSPAPIDPGVVHERRVALNWLIDLGGFGWDSMPTPT